jgi:hypothetical protein
MATWRQFLKARMAAVGDASPVVAVAPNESALDVNFDEDYGTSEGPAILIWTADRVYFPVTYDGMEWLDSAPRNPVSEGQAHVGGE